MSRQYAIWFWSIIFIMGVNTCYFWRQLPYDFLMLLGLIILWVVLVIICMVQVYTICWKNEFNSTVNPIENTPPLPMSAF
jgi:hypothetical protein